MDFLRDDVVVEEKSHGFYKVVVADDDEEVHRVTKMIFKNFKFEGKKLEVIDTYSGEETIRVLKEHPDTAILFLDVVMETNRAGLDVVEHLRNELGNTLTRIILRTGQPGDAPEEVIIREYDINDYRLKTELTVKRLYTTLYSALRNYRDLLSLESHRKGLEKIIETSGRLFQHNSLKEFLTSVLDELGNFQQDNSGMIFIREDIEKASNGFVTIEQSNRNKIIAATGKYEDFVDEEIETLPELNFLNRWINSDIDKDKVIHKVNGGFIIVGQGKSMMNNYIFIEGQDSVFDFDLINLFLSNFSIALDNYILNNMVNTTQREIIYALAETVESHFEETGSHIQRISEMIYQFGLCMHMSYAEGELLKVAATMHDLGKIAVPDAILKKPGKLTEEEFEVIKTHTTHGYKILSKSDLPVLRMAADIALNHHEKFDGSGYPQGLSGKEIPLSSRMLAIIDVFDAMTHKRCYKDASPIEDAIQFINQNKGTHFDPHLVDIFMSNLKQILEKTDNYIEV